MAYRRCLNVLTRHGSTIQFSPSQSLQPLKRSLTHFNLLSPHCRALVTQIFEPVVGIKSNQSRSVSSDIDLKNPRLFSDTGSKSDEEDEEEEEEEEEEDYVSSEDESELENVSNIGSIDRAYTIEEKIKEAAEIGYKVIGPLKRSDHAFKPYEPVFAVVQIGSHQFKVSNGDSIYTERLKFCEVNDKLILNKVLLLGSKNQTIVGRPVLLDAAVQAVVEEHALDAKVIIFKKKRRKNYRRTNGHRQELTKLRIVDIQGIEKPEMPLVLKKARASSKKVDKVATAA